MLAGGVAIIVATWGLSELIRLYALRIGLLDVPNPRSSHTIPTPRGGGLAIVIVTLATMNLLNLHYRLPRVTVVLTLGGGLIALVGALDDRRGLPVYVRLCAHCAAAALAVVLLGSIPSTHIGQHLLSFGYAAIPITFVGVLWFLNLFNFMDGIDGLAIAEAVFISGAAALLATLNGAPMNLVIALLVLAASCAGFVPLNWAPARTFMGDVGSGFLGYTIAVLALSTIIQGTLTVWSWILLSGTFLTDATVTLLRRLARGENIHKAHRTHAYQRLAARWRSHPWVTLAYAAFNTIWLLPLAWLSLHYRNLGALLCAIGIAPLIIFAIASGAGERPR